MSGISDTAAAPGAPAEIKRPRFGLSWKLLALTGLFVMVSEVLIFVPSIASFRLSWLSDRLGTADAVSVVLTASEWTSVPRQVQDDLLDTVGADAIAIRDGEVSRLLAAVEMPLRVDLTTDIRSVNPLVAAGDALATLASPTPRNLRIIGQSTSGIEVEVIMGDHDLRSAMIGYASNIIVISAIVSLLTAAVVFIALNRLLVRPMRRMSENMIAFSEAPEDPQRVIRPTGRADEIGVAEDRLAEMQRDLQNTLSQQRRLADLGLAVSKINHDLRNMLASAHLFSDRIGSLPDPTVQKFAPKLILALDRAIAYTQATLTYGKPQEAVPERRLIQLHRLVDEVAEILSVENRSGLRWENLVPAGLEIDADADQLFRVLVNLCRNAIQAMEGGRDDALVRRLAVEARRDGGIVTLRVRDTGPGIPAHVREHLFEPFRSTTAGGTGLGLAIAAEIVKAHGGVIRLSDNEGPGAVFEIVIPDRPLEFPRPAAVPTARAG
ncbi:MAG: HAMP domain-containing histidine kinase [Bauldia sp.]|nr:HAMP domain-containing histidine kinase [Bauldia sp.]